MKTRIKNMKLRETKTNTRHTKHRRHRRHTKSNKMKGGSFILNFFRGSSSSENKELDEDLKKLSTYKETNRKNMQLMYDNAKNAEEFNKNYASFTKTVDEINTLVKDINRHRSIPVINAKNMTNAKNPTNAKNSANAKNPANTTGNTGAVGAIGAGAGLVGAGAGAVVGVMDAKNALMGSP